MRYKLKLNKTKAYEVAICHAEGIVILPSMRKCDFKNYGRIYWLSFWDDMGVFWKLTIQTCCGKTSVLYRRMVWSTDKLVDVAMVDVDSTWLFDSGMLQEVV